MPLFYPNISQITYFGVGDIDECSIIASFWAARQAGFTGKLPTIGEFRRQAGVPDAPGPTGLTNTQVWQGLTRTGLAEGASILRRGTTWSDFVQSMQVAGTAASVALNSGALPIGYRYGFQGAHRVGLVWENGQWYIANPLAPEGSGPQAISEADIKRAILSFGPASQVVGILFNAPKVATATPATTKAPVPGAAAVSGITPARQVDAFLAAKFYAGRPHKRV